MTYSIFDKDKGTVISGKARIAKSFGLRLKGLMFKKEIDEKEALIFHNAPAIHTCFMRFAIDIVFLDKSNKVIRICEAVKPWKMVTCSKAAITIELPANRAKRRSLALGDQLEITLGD
ncbi:MAG: DUF192 domain-containing protein [Candidatus Omnitrophica bacterium]|nr:DUF192 domain-containing protein [Candidatus Omnitrophota bacterium]